MPDWLYVPAGRAPVGVGLAVPGNKGPQIPRLPAEQPGRQRNRVQLGQQVSRSSAACNTGYVDNHSVTNLINLPLKDVHVHASTTDELTNVSFRSTWPEGQSWKATRGAWTLSSALSCPTAATRRSAPPLVCTITMNQ